MAEKKRSENFSVIQREFVLSFIEENRVMENKEGTVKIISKKQKLWKELECAFNAKFETQKTVAQLKILWKGMKSSTKKVVAQRKRESLKTGGGVNTAPDLSVTEEVIADIIAAELEPLTNPFDGDGDGEVEDAENKPTAAGPSTASTKPTRNDGPTTLDFYNISRKRLEIEERKVVAQERIADVSNIQTYFAIVIR